MNITARLEKQMAEDEKQGDEHKDIKMAGVEYASI